jgi:zinc/manganese transport system ATP-binding protein
VSDGHNITAPGAPSTAPAGAPGADARTVPAPSAASRPAADAVIELRGAAVRVGNRTLWTGVDLTLHAGEFMAVLGPNGVGKTTLIKVVLGLVPASAGTVSLLGRPPGQENHRVGYLPQRRALDSSLRVRGIDLVRLGLDGDRWGVPLPGARFFSARARTEEEHVRHVIELVGAASYALRPVGELSGGEQQRLLIAQALVRDPAVLLLDEPLEGLDMPSQSSATALISRISREERIAVLMVAHDVNPLMPYLDQVAYVGEGAIVAGDPEAVVTSETLSRLYGTRIDVVHTPDGRLAVLGQPEVTALCHGDECA